jgi:hypothetical protein
MYDDTDFRNPAELTKQLREKLARRPKSSDPPELATNRDVGTRQRWRAVSAGVA